MTIRKNEKNQSDAKTSGCEKNQQKNRQTCAAPSISCIGSFEGHPSASNGFCPNVQVCHSCDVTGSVSVVIQYSSFICITIACVSISMHNNNDEYTTVVIDPVVAVWLVVVEGVGVVAW